MPRTALEMCKPGLPLLRPPRRSSLLPPWLRHPRTTPGTRSARTIMVHGTIPAGVAATTTGAFAVIPTVAGGAAVGVADNTQLKLSIHKQVEASTMKKKSIFIMVTILVLTLGASAAMACCGGWGWGGGGW